MTAFEHTNGDKYSRSNNFRDVEFNKYDNFEPVKNSLKKAVAFTLAEVLITLGIIGVVAAITLPALISRYEKQETVSQLKKVYAVLTNTTQMAINEHGDAPGWDVKNQNSVASGKHFAENYLMPYLNVLRTCDDNNSEDCNYPIYKLNGQSYNNNDHYKYAYRFYLTDGTLVAVRAFSSANHPKQVNMIIDINGKKRPNKLGKDIFFLQYLIKTTKAASKPYEGRITPCYADGYARATLLGTGNDNYCNKNKSGMACLAIILMDGWEIKDDYPW